MFNLAYTAAPIENTNPKINKIINKIKKIDNNKLEKTLNLNNYDDDDENELHDYNTDEIPNQFNPPPRTESVGVNKTKETDNNIDSTESVKEDFKNLPDLSQENYKKHVNYYEQASGVNTTNKELIDKLNYMILLLEEQRDFKQNSVTEELILYLFLGIFIIFIIDSFARASKYVR